MTTAQTPTDVAPAQRTGGRTFAVNVLASLVATLIAAAISLVVGRIDRFGRAYALLLVWTIPFVVGIVVGWLTNRSQSLLTTVIAVMLSAASFGAFFVAMPGADDVFRAAVPRPPADRGEPAPTSPASPGRSTALSVEDAVDVRPCGSYYWDDTAPQFDKQAVTPAGVACTIDDSMADGYLDFLVPVDATSLRALVGVDSRSENTTTSLMFAVLDVDGNVLVERETGYGRPSEIDVAVGDHDRVRLRIRVTDYSVDPEESPLTAAWGDLRFES